MVRLLKSGEWAVGGHDVRSLCKGHEIDLGPKENADLVRVGWAEYVTTQVDPPSGQGTGDGADDGGSTGQDGEGDKAAKTQPPKPGGRK
jgi:hypothetical protein